MKVRTARRPSPAMIVAMIALCLGLGGSAIAAGDLTKSQVKKIAKKQANKQITKRAPGLSVAHAKTADSATTATTAGKASNIFGATANDAGQITVATLPGTTVEKTSNVFRYTFPRSVQGCVPVASGTFDGEAWALLAGTGNPNSVDVTTSSGTGNSVIVLCP